MHAWFRPAAFLANVRAPKWRIFGLVLPLLAGGCAGPPLVGPRGPVRTASNLETARRMLAPVFAEIRTHYYDPAFGGGDLAAVERDAAQQLAKARNTREAFMIIAQAVRRLGDSHTRFLPPAGPGRTHYGWALRSAGPYVYVAAVEPGSDAARQGVRPGERVHRIHQFPVRRDNLHFLRYQLGGIDPQAVVEVELEDAAGVRRTVRFASTQTEHPFRPSRDPAAPFPASAGPWVDAVTAMAGARGEVGQPPIFTPPPFPRRPQSEWIAPGVLLWRLRSFQNSRALATGLEEAESCTHLLLDLRGNAGGLEEAMLTTLGALLPGPAVVGQVRTRAGLAPLAVGAGPAIPARIHLLIDGDTASAAEVVARGLQLAGRATVYGERSAGLVNRGREHRLTLEADGGVVLFGVIVTEAALVLADGRPLEKVGVSPDREIVPTPRELAAGEDPVLAAAAREAGVSLTPAAAGALTRRLTRPVYD